MKLAVVPLPNETKCEVVPKEGQAPPPIFFVSRTKQVAILSGLLLCAVGLVATTYFATSEAAPHVTTVAPRQAALAHAPAPEVPMFRPQVRMLEETRVLKAGDYVMLGGSNAPKVRKIAAPPNQAVLLKRGGSIQALYVAGENSYVVMSDKETRVVRRDEIRGVVPPVLATAT